MKFIAISALCATTLAGCGTTSGNTSSFLNNGTDISFVNQGTTSCPGVIASGNPIYERYPLRCGPQQQILQR